MSDFVQLMNEFSAEIDKTVVCRRNDRATIARLEADNARLREALDDAARALGRAANCARAYDDNDWAIDAERAQSAALAAREG